MKSVKIFILSSAVSFLALSPVIAAEMDHSQHQGMDHSQHMKAKPKVKGRLDVLTTMTKSGEAREAGYDGKYAMEPTTINDSMMTQCAKASRGLIMVDNKTWEKCGGKPQGWSKGPGKQEAQTMDHSQHMKH